MVAEVYYVSFFNNNFYNYGDWGLGIGDWGLGIGDWAQSPIPNPQSPIPISMSIHTWIYTNNLLFEFAKPISENEKKIILEIFTFGLEIKKLTKEAFLNIGP